MTTLTARYAMPKPELTDLVTDGWEAIADLADAADAHLGAVADQAAADVGAEAVARAAGVASRIPLAVIDALGDLLVGTGPDAVARLPMGTPGYQLRVKDDGSGLAWLAPAVTDLTGYVPKAGAVMTGDLQGPSFHATGAGVFDGGNRVYSLTNPPPAAGGAVINQTIRGTITASTTAATATATIAAVVLAKTQLRYLGARGMVSTNNDPTGAEGTGMGTIVLTNTTTVTYDRTPPGTQQSAASSVSYELTEWS